MLLVVFVPPETGFFDELQRLRLRDILIEALQRHNLTGELIAVWEEDGGTGFMGNPHWAGFVSESGYLGLYARRNAHISVT